MGNEPDTPEKAMDWLEAAPYHARDFRTMDAYKIALDEWADRVDAARGQLLKWAAHGVEREGMMSRDEVLGLLASCMKDPGSAYDSAQAYALAQVLGTHDQHELALYDELEAKAEREAEEAWANMTGGA